MKFCSQNFCFDSLKVNVHLMWTGRTLSVTWSPDASKIYSGSSDGYATFSTPQALLVSYTDIKVCLSWKLSFFRDMCFFSERHLDFFWQVH